MTEIQIEFDVPAKMRDGTVLRADVYRPGGSGPWPVLLSRLPYGKQMPLAVAVLDPLAVARRGFMMVVQDTRGRFASEGEWEPWTHEESDGYDTVRWAGALPGANGSVGMVGASYFGNTQWMAALSKPPELKAIAPMVTWSDPDDGLWTRGGAIELGITAPWTLMMGADALMRRRQHRTRHARRQPRQARTGSRRPGRRRLRRTARRALPRVRPARSSRTGL